MDRFAKNVGMKADIGLDFCRPTGRHLCVTEFCLQKCTDASGEKTEDVPMQAVTSEGMTGDLRIPRTPAAFLKGLRGGV
jgi:hypothetical protein